MGVQRLNSITLFAITLFFFGEVVLLFFTPRTETFQLFTLFFALFAAYVAMIPELRHVRTAAFLGVLFRCVAWLSFPALSEDIYRFIWDGAIILDGHNPYLETPTAFLSHHLEPPFEMLYPLLESSGQYSVYPTIIQIFSAFGALAANDPYLASLIIKLPILIAEIGTIWILPRILIQMRLSPKLSFLYFLNPLVIIELCGNGHFEAVAIFFVLWSIKLMLNKRFKWAAAALALAVGTKLAPLLMLPFLLKAVPGKKRMEYTFVFLPTLVLLFAPMFISSAFENFTHGLGLYITSYEFNASIYSIIRQITFGIPGHNMSTIAGPLLLVIAIAAIIYLWFKQKPLLRDAMEKGMLAMVLYFIFSSTVHPWYISTLVIFGMFCHKPYVIVWSALVFFSYAAYNTNQHYLGNILILVEYLLLAAVYFYPKITARLLPSIHQ